MNKISIDLENLSPSAAKLILDAAMKAALEAEETSEIFELVHFAQALEALAAGH